MFHLVSLQKKHNSGISLLMGTGQKPVLLLFYGCAAPLIMVVNYLIGLDPSLYHPSYGSWIVFSTVTSSIYLS